MNNHIDIVSLTPDRLDTAVAATSRAFWPDPMFGFFARNAVSEHRMLPYFISAVMKDALRHGHVDVVLQNNQVAATSSWLAPGDSPRSRKREMQISLRCARALVTGRNRLKGIALLDDMAKSHPTEPHWYLGLIGVDPKHQGSGIGSALLQHRLTECDHSGMPAYLETQKPENVPYYSRFGFTVAKVIEHSGCPPLWTMWREPQA